MNILMISSNDAANKRLSNIMKSFLKRGHRIWLYYAITASNMTEIFSDIIQDVEIVYAINEEVISDIDVIFCTNDTVWNVLQYDKYIFRYDMLNLGQLRGDGGDFIFLPGEVEEYELAERAPKMYVGNTMFDDIEVTGRNHKRLLFIDSGHYPFGTEGKKILARVLLEICKKFPDYELVIKPRFLLSDEVVTHRNLNHLYYNIEKECGGKIPVNLNMLKEHIDMQKLIAQSDTVICLYTSAYLDAIAGGKGLVVIDGLPNEDSYDLNEHYHWKKAREVIKKSGCLVKYQDVLEYLPKGLECNKELVEKEVNYCKNVSDKIVETVECVYHDYIKKEKYLKPGYYEYEQLVNGISENDYCSWIKVKNLRIYNNLIYGLARKRDCINHSLKIDSLLDDLEIMLENEELIFFEYHELDSLFKNKLNILIKNNRDILMHNDIMQSFYLDTLLYTDHDAFVKEMQLEEGFVFSRAYAYYKARALVFNREYEKAIPLFERHIEETECSTYNRYVTDFHKYISSSYYHIGWCYLALKKYEKARDAYEKCNEYEKGNHGRAKRIVSQMENMKLIESV